jgi:hypothetical protein
VSEALTPKEHAERAIRKAYHLAEDEPLSEALEELRLAIVQELWDFLAENASPITPPTKGNAA